MFNSKVICTSIFVGATLLISGCATTAPSISAIDGSKADGKITMRVVYSGFAQQLTNDSIEKAKDMAIQRCQAWNYKNVEMFGDPTITQERTDLLLGTISHADIRFQCTDK